MKKFVLIINLTFLTVLAFLLAGLIATKQHGYAATFDTSIEIKSAVSCGSFLPSSANAKDSQEDNLAATPGTSAGSGCLHQSGLGLLGIIPGDKRKGLRKC